MAAPIVGLDIGSAQIKAVELVVSGKEGLVVTNVAFMPTPVGLLQNNVLTDPVLMGRVVKQMLKEGGIKSKRVVGSVTGQASVVVRIIEVPKMSPAELAETMKWEVERHVSFAPNDVTMDYQVLPIQDTSESNPNISVLLAAAQQEVVNGYVDMLFAAGLDPIAIDIEPLASGRALLDVQDGRPMVRHGGGDNHYDLSSLSAARETVAIVNIGASNTDVSIYEDGQLIFPRSLPIAGESLTRAVSEVLGYTMEQAERVKIDHATVIVERMGEYTGSFYGQPDDAHAADFRYQEEPVSSFDTSLADADLGAFRSPFDQTEDDAATLPPIPDFSESGLTFGSEPERDPLDRTQPIPRRSLDLARHSPAADFSGDFDLGSSINTEETRVQVFEAIAPVLAEMATELRRSLEYHRSRTRGRGVDRILLCGGTANLQGVDQFLDAELQVPVTVANPFQGVHVATKQYDPAYLASIASIFSVAIGLAEREAVLQANPPDPGLKAPKAASPSVANITGKFKLPFGKKDQAAAGASVSE